MIDEAIEAAQRAATDANPRLTALLRFNALNAGWSQEAADSLRVEVADSLLQILGSAAAEDAEYGDDETRPKPAVRQFKNRRDAIDAEIVAVVEEMLGGLL